jgi:hypothetical protein
MKIRELLEDRSENDLSLKLSAALNQIAGRVIDTGADSKMSLTSILNMLSELGVHVSEEQFRDMVDNEPLNNVVASVEGDKVTFIGQRKDSGSSIKPDQSTATLEKMAKRASSKRQ